MPCLPIELLDTILILIPEDVKTLKSAHATCRFARRRVAPRLFRTLTLIVDDARWNEADRDAKRSLKAIGRYVGEVSLRAKGLSRLQTTSLSTRDVRSLLTLLPLLPRITCLSIHSVRFDRLLDCWNIVGACGNDLRSLIMRRVVQRSSAEWNGAQYCPSLENLDVDNHEHLIWLTAPLKNQKLKQVKVSTHGAADLSCLQDWIISSATVSRLRLQVDQPRIDTRSWTFCETLLSSYLDLC
jgi:hypothetical protein